MPLVLLLLLLAANSLRPNPVMGQTGVEVRGKLIILDKGSKRGTDLASAVIWLEGGRGARAADLQVATQRKEFTPDVLVASVGSQVSFPNRDPFNHNVFSRSDEAPFDLGLFGRDQTRSVRLSKPGIVRIYCNVHAQMWAVVVVLETPFVARPGADGAFRIANVPPGGYRLRIWHERGGETTREVEIGPGGLADLTLSLDASAFKHRPHLNKFGKAYDTDGRRY